MTTPTINREQWLQHAVTLLRPHMAARGVTIPTVNVSCSWPGGGSARKRIGECWPRAASKAGVNEIFISPKLSDSAQVIGVLLHELAHAVDDCANGHGAKFAAIGTAMGLEGKPTQMQPSIDDMLAYAAIMTAGWGLYPHEVLDKSHGPKKQAARMIKCLCGECGALWRMAGKTIEQAEGHMTCPICQEGNVQIG